MFITQNTDTNDTVLLNEAGANVTIASGVTYDSGAFSGYAFRLQTPPFGGLGAQFTLLGSLVSEASGIELISGLAELTIGASGTLIADSTAVSISGAVRNAGLISGYVAIATVANSPLLVTNTGTVQGRIEGNTGAVSITNTGWISGALVTLGNGGDRLTIGVTGSIVADVDLGFGSDIMRNDGTLTGNLLTGSGGDMVTNTGTVGGNVIVGSTAADTTALTNAGLISGSVSTEAGCDTVVNTGRITGGITTGAGNDLIDTHLGSVGGTLSGGLGFDTYVIAGTETISDNGAAGEIDAVFSYGGHRLAAGLETLTLLGTARVGIGNALDNTLVASGVGASLRGGGGNDTLFGAEGDDTLQGGAGNDSFYDSEGQNTITAGTGDDTVSVTGGENVVFGEVGVDYLQALGGTNVLNGGAGDDTLAGGAGADYLIGEDGVDLATDFYSTAGVIVSLATGLGSGGWAEGDLLSGIEKLTGSDFADQLTGASGNVRLDGRDGTDTLNGGVGNDKLTGGGAADVFAFTRFAGFGGVVIGWGKDTISDFQDGVDRIDLSAAFDVVGFSDLTVTTSRGSAVITVGSDTITLTGIAGNSISAADFIFG